MTQTSFVAAAMPIIMRCIKTVRAQCPYLEYDDLKQDLICETLVALEKWDSKGGKSFSSFLHTRLIWYCQWYRIKEARRYIAEVNYAYTYPETVTEEGVAESDFIADLPRYIKRRLPNTTQKIFSMLWNSSKITDMEEVCSSEVDRTYLSYSLGLTKRTIRRHLSRIKTMLQEMRYG